MQTKELPQVITNAHPIYHVGDGVGCLLIHGFMASPNELSWLAHHLIQEGRTVLAPRLPGHGIDHTAMTRMRWQDWLGHVQDAHTMLKATCDQVFIVGHSMGGLLGILHAVAHPIAGMTIAAAPLSVPNRLIPYARMLSVAQRYSEHPTDDDYQDYIKDMQTRLGLNPVGRVHYSTWSNRAVHELYELILGANDVLGQIECPIQTIYALNDQTVSVTDASMIHDKAKGARSIDEVIITEGDHLIFMDRGFQQANNAVSRFIQSVLG